jgi:hypothetical protein
MQGRERHGTDDMFNSLSAHCVSSGGARLDVQPCWDRQNLRPLDEK